MPPSRPANYRLQLMFYEQCCSRGFDVLVDGYQIVGQYSPQRDQGGFTGGERPGAAIEYVFIAQSGTMTVTIVGTGASFSDVTPILNALTLEVEPGPRHHAHVGQQSWHSCDDAGEQWAQIDLPATSAVQSVVIWFPCAVPMIHVFAEVLVNGEWRDCGALTHAVSSSNVTFECRITGTAVRVRNDGGYFTMTELQIFAARLD